MRDANTNSKMCQMRRQAKQVVWCLYVTVSIQKMLEKAYVPQVAIVVLIPLHSTFNHLNTTHA